MTGHSRHCLVSFALILAACMLAPLRLHSAQPSIPTYDLVITNARIVDGSGNPWFRADVGIKDGRVARIGRIDAAPAQKTIDAKGQIVAPGFIDVHPHLINLSCRQPKFVRRVSPGPETAAARTDIDVLVLPRESLEPILHLIAHGSVAGSYGFGLRAPRQTRAGNGNSVDRSERWRGRSVTVSLRSRTYAKTLKSQSRAYVARTGGSIHAHAQEGEK